MVQAAQLSGKGIGLMEMTSIGITVPAGFTVSIQTCEEYYKLGRKLPAGLEKEVRDAILKLEKWKVTHDDMELAWKELEAAWRLNPSDIRTATGLVVLCRYRQAPRADMEHWFQLGLQTGMDGSDLCLQKSIFLSPDWGGPVEEQLAFGRECTAHPEYGHEAGTIITRAHAGNAIDLGIHKEYFIRPEVWKDMSQGYEAYFRQNPDMINMRLRYAQRAWQTEHWEILGHQLKQLNLSILDLERIGGAEVLEQMFADARAHG